DKRTYKFCSLYDNGASNPDDVKRQSTSPLPPIPAASAFGLGGPCADTEVVCLGGPKQGEKCQGDDRNCDSAPGANDGVCDACPVHGGATTGAELFTPPASSYALCTTYAALSPPGAPNPAGCPR